MNFCSRIVSSGFSYVNAKIESIKNGIKSAIENDDLSIEKTSRVVYVVFWDGHRGLGATNSVGFAVGDKLVQYQSRDEAAKIYQYKPFKKYKTRQLRWPIKVTEQKFQKLLDMVNDGSFENEGGLSCVSKTVHVLNKCDILNVPYPISEFPLLLFSYLTLGSKARDIDLQLWKFSRRFSSDSIQRKLMNTSRYIIQKFFTHNVLKTRGTLLSDYFVNSKTLMVEAVIISMVAQALLLEPQKMLVLGGLFYLTNEIKDPGSFQGPFSIDNKLMTDLTDFASHIIDSGSQLGSKVLRYFGPNNKVHSSI